MTAKNPRLTARRRSGENVKKGFMAHWDGAAKRFVAIFLGLNVKKGPFQLERAFLSNLTFKLLAYNFT
jgi:hypothetical protein